ncbi:MAG TPA: diguanylate cyclase, partial [Nitrospiria bacterium]|nr:diguanylate cyclase [Nitrospiria bacterium]
MENQGEGRSFCLLPDTTGQKGAEGALCGTKDQYQILFETNPHPMWVYDLETLRFLAVNNAAMSHYGYTSEDFIAMTIKDIRPSEDISLIMNRLDKILRTSTGFNSSGIWRHKKKDGSIIDVEVSSHSLTFKGRRARLVLSNDVTERRKVEDALRIKTEQLATVTTAMAAFLKTGNWREASAIILRSALTRTESEYGFIGVVAEGPVLRVLAYEGMIWDKEANREFYDDAVRTYHEVGYIEFTNLDNLFGSVITGGKVVIANDPSSDIRSGRRLPDGHPVINSFLGVPILKGDEVIGIIGVANRPGGYNIGDRDRVGILSQAVSVLYDSYRRYEKEITLERDRKQADEMVQYLAYYDVLTGLPNRTLFHDRLQQAIATARSEGRTLALLILDLNRFKEINNTLGHPNGDIILQQIGLRLQDAIKEADAIARFGGDEFAIFLSGADANAAIKAAGTIIKRLEEPFVLEWLSLDISASIGIALFPGNGEDADILIRRADIAMHMAKKTESGFCVYLPMYDQHSHERLALMGELRHAIMQDQLFLLYQPKIDLKKSEPVGVEALVRWQHPKSGIIPPDKFISLAEHTGLIKQLTFWVLKEALRQSRVL